jgi:hypothetical protein
VPVLVPTPPPAVPPDVPPPEPPDPPPPDWANWNEPVALVSFMTVDCGQAFAAKTPPQIKAVEKASLAR